MRFARAAIHSFVLTVLDLAFIIVGYGAWYTFRAGNQILIQGSIAAALIIVTFVIWNRSLDDLGLGRFGLHRLADALGAYLGAFLWFPVLFIPIHFLATGNFTSTGNITATWEFQALVNLIAVSVAKVLSGDGGRVSLPM